MRRFYKAVIAGAVMGVGLASIPDRPNLSDPPTLLLTAACWLAVAIGAAWMLSLLVRGIYTRRHLAESTYSESSAEPMEMRPQEQAWDAELLGLGFLRLGIMTFAPPLARAQRLWLYADLDGRIRVTMERNYGQVNFITTFVDDFTLSTRNKSSVPALQLPHYASVNVPVPGNSLTPAYHLHLEGLRALAPVHGDALPCRSVVDAITIEKRLMPILLPELIASSRLKFATTYAVVTLLPLLFLSLATARVAGML